MLKFPNVFSEGLGQLDGQYTIRLDETVPPVQHAPRRIAVALRPQLKDTLDALEAQGVIAQVTQLVTNFKLSMIIFSLL